RYLPISLPALPLSPFLPPPPPTSPLFPYTTLFRSSRTHPAPPECASRSAPRLRTSGRRRRRVHRRPDPPATTRATRALRAPAGRSEEHTSELQSRENLVCRLLLEKKKNTTKNVVQT